MPNSDGTLVWGPFVLFGIVNLFTPGPNVILLANSGSAWGLKKTIPHLLGFAIGFPLMVFLVLYGSDQVFKQWPWVLTALTAVSLAYVLWLAIRIMKIGFSVGPEMKVAARPMSLLESTAFQWVNGKGWQIAITIATLYNTTNHIARILEVIVLSAITLAAGLVWIELGKRIAVLLKRPIAKKIYYSALATLLLLTTWPKGIANLLSHIQQRS